MGAPRASAGERGFDGRTPAFVFCRRKAAKNPRKQSVCHSMSRKPSPFARICPAVFLAGVHLLAVSAATGEPAPVIESPPGVEMVLVPAGEFQMGTDTLRLADLVEKLRGDGPSRPIRREWFDDETPRRTVSLDAYYIDRYEVTNGQYRVFMDATGRPEPLYWQDRRLHGAQMPVVGVSWDDAVAYAEWAGKTLPTEAQWERAARADIGGATYPWGDEWPPPTDTGNFGAGIRDGYGGPAPVGSFAPNALGIHDLVGNVAEWCLDAYSETYYASAPTSNPVNEAAPDARVLRAVRGGGWSGTAVQLRSAYRGRDIPTARYDLLGFRCVLPTTGESAVPATAPSASVPGPGASTAAAGDDGRARPHTVPADDRVQRPAVVFTDVTEAAGVTFRHAAGLSDNKHLMETMGAGAAFFDADGDGDMDLYLVNSGSLSERGSGAASRNALYRNDGDGAFTDVTSPSGTNDAGYGMGAAAADYDNDGDRDLYVTNYGSNALYRNRGDGTFEDVAHAARVAGDAWSVSSAFTDIDNDGDLDLYVVNYVEYDLAMKPCRNVDVGLLEYCHPRFYAGQADTLYRNEGDGTFVDISEAAGVANSAEGKGLGIAVADYDNDGWPDIYIANDTTRNFLYRNAGDGSFVDVALAAGVGYNGGGLPEGGMGVDFGDYNGDGSLDLFVTNSSAETNTLYRNNRDGSFTDVSDAAGLAADSLSMLSFGTRFLDYDNDMDLDIFVVSGGLQPNVALLSDGAATYAQRDQLFVNDGAGGYTELPDASVGAFVGRGAAFADYDDDGDTDVYVANSNGRGRLLRNDAADGNAWLRVELVGVQGNRDGIGARVVVDAGGRLQARELSGGSSYASASDPRLLFGLGKAPKVDRLAVRWPGGAVQWLAEVAPNRTIRIIEGE